MKEAFALEVDGATTIVEVVPSRKGPRVLLTVVQGSRGKTIWLSSLDALKVSEALGEAALHAQRMKP